MKMKRLCLAILLLALPLAPMGWTGATCKPKQERITYNSLSSVGISVNQAYAAWNDQVVSGKATFSPNVAAAYNKFQSVFNVAVTAAAANPSAIASQDVVDAANAVYAAIKQFTH